MPKLAVYLTIAGQDELLGVHDFDVVPRAGETLDLEHHGELLNLHADRLHHRVDKLGHVPKLMCSRQAGRAG